MFQPRARAGSKLTTVLDSEGREIQAESRKDEEQDIKLEETIDMLLAAGYFRARIKGLSAFDKVVGGMTWCIVTCNFDVDVDLLFQENSTIGQKISLTEKIVAVLPKMKCPHRIEPHQIQGMDFIHIFPVVQWLVKKAIATREEMGDTNRQFSVSQFNKYNTLPEDEELIKNTSIALPTINAVRSRFGPRRKFRRLGDHVNEDKSTRVQYTLLEYGRQYGYSGKSSDEKNTDSKNSSHVETHEQINQQEETETDRKKTKKQSEQKKISALMKSMIQTEDKQHRPSAAVVGSMVTLQSDEIKRAQAEYSKKQTEFESQIEKPGTLRYQKKVEQNLRKQLETLKQKQTTLETEYEEKKSKYVEVHDKLKELENLEEQIDTEMKKLDDLESGENQVVLEKLRSLVAVNDTHKKKEQEFKAKCKEELSALQSSISELEETSGGITPEDEERNQAIESQHEIESNKMKKLRLALAKKNREISSLQRKIDEVPSRSELSQYQSRFIELYNQVSATHKETKQFYTLYNTLENSKLWLEKEIDLLNSIYDNFQRGMSSQGNKEQFLKQIEHIVEGIKQNRAKLEKQKEAEKMKRDLLNDKYLDLLEKQRIYFKTVKDLKEELKKNEMMTAKLSEYEP